MNSADRPRVDARDVASPEWARAAGAHNLPEPAKRGAHAAPLAAHAASLDAPSTENEKRWWRTAARLVRDAAIGLLLIAAIPLAYIAANGDGVWFDSGGLRERLEEIEQLRPLTLPKDGRMSPADAGYAFHALQPAHEHAEFPMRAVPDVADFGWQKLEATSHLFAAYRAPKSGGLPNSTEIVAAAAVGLSAEEMAYLKTIAEAPVWAQIDNIVGASSVDLIGGRFLLPFKSEARALSMPMYKFDGTRALANAGVSRAAYYVALGDMERAEAALKTVVSFGFVLIDNGTSAIDGLIGQVVANIGRNGLHQLYTLTGNEAGKRLTMPPPTVQASRTGASMIRTRGSAARERIIDDVADPQTPRTLRYESLRNLSFGTCGSIKGVLFGHPDETEEAFREARVSLTRFSSEEELVKLYYNSPEHSLTEGTPNSLGGFFVLGAAAVTSRLTDNPRLMACTRLLTSIR